MYISFARGQFDVNIVTLLQSRYSKLTVSVKWNNYFSYHFSVGSGVHQGSFLSPTLFTVMTIIIALIKAVDLRFYTLYKFIFCLVIILYLFAFICE